MEQWTSTTDVRLAAALGTMGVVIRPKRTLDERSGRRLTRFYLGLASVDGQVLTKRVLGDLRKGTLPGNHPLRAILWGMENRRLLLDLANQGKGCRLVEATPGIWRYTPATGEGPRGLIRGTAYFKTGDLKLVSALGLAGLEVARIEGPEHGRTFYIPLQGPGPRAGGLPAADARAVAEAWRRDKEELPWADPIAQGLRGLHNRERLLNVVEGMEECVLLRRGGRKAVVRTDASDEAWEKAERFLS